MVKIDVEGMEHDVIRGADLEAHRPWVLVIEATKPNTVEDSSQEWEPLVLAAGYRIVLFDGLNRFYVRDDLDDVAELLGSPANVFDRWVSYQLVDKERALEESMVFAEAMERQRSDADVYARTLERALRARWQTEVVAKST